MYLCVTVSFSQTRFSLHLIMIYCHEIDTSFLKTKITDKQIFNHTDPGKWILP